MATTHYIWDVESDNLLMETDENGQTVATYTHEPGLHGQLISQRRNGQTYYHHYDGEGNTRAVTDQNGNIVETATYSAFGEVVEKISSIVNPFGYRGALGYYTNPTTSEVDVRARVYKPPLGRWLSVDPIGLTWHRDVDWLQLLGRLATRYVYVSNNPINRGDPSGLQEEKDDPCEKKTFANPCAGSSKGFTDVSVCVRPIRDGVAGGHVYLKIDCGNGVVFSFGGLRDEPCKKCGCLDKQLRTAVYPFRKGEQNPDFPIDQDEGGKHICEPYKIGTAPDKLFECLANVAIRARDCCIPYEALAVGDPAKGCNSNCLAWWMVVECFKLEVHGKTIDVPKDHPKPIPGWKKKPPECMTVKPS